MGQKLIIAVYDYPRGDLADLEVRLALRHYLPEWRLETSSVPSFKTLPTGFVVAQAALSPLATSLGSENFIVYANCAPRKDAEHNRKHNEGEGLVYAELSNGTKIVAVNSGYSLSVVKHDIVKLHRANAAVGGSQFRSRDNFPPCIGLIAQGKLSEAIGEALDPMECIPEIPDLSVAYIDSFGNLKLTLRADDPLFTSLAEGQQVRIKIGRTPRVATKTTGSFNINEGELALAPGSSGYGRRFVELFLRGGSAQQHFDAETEDRIKFQL
jgi:hypothetical protein